MSKLLLNKDKKVISIEITLSIILFIISSLSCFYLVNQIIGLGSNMMRDIKNFLPSNLVYTLPVFTSIFFFNFTSEVTFKRRWKLLHYYGVITFFVSFFALAYLLFLTIFKAGTTKYDSLFSFYPVDVVIIGSIFIFISFLCLLACFLTRGRRKDNYFFEDDISRASKICFSIFIPFASYFMGMGLFGIRYFFYLPFIDKNWVYMVLTYLLFLLPFYLFILFLFYKYKNKRNSKSFRLNYCIFLGISFCLLSAFFICYLINPYFVNESLSFEFRISLLLKFPLEVVLIALWIIVPTSIYLIKAFKRKL